MPRGVRPKPPPELVSDDIIQKLKSIRPVRFYINKRKRKGEAGNALQLRKKYVQLSIYKQTKFLQKAVDQYLQFLDEQDIAEKVQSEGRLFDYLLSKPEQKKYFDSIHAPAQPKRRLPPAQTEDEEIYTQNGDSDTDDDSTWKKPRGNLQRRYRKFNREAREAYAMQVKNFAENLPDRLKIDYLRYAEPPRRKTANDSHISIQSNSDSDSPESVRQRRKSLTNLPDSLNTSTMTNGHSDHERKLTRTELRELHECMPSAIYFEETVSDDEKPSFSTAMAKNAHLRSIFKQLSEKQKLRYIRKSIDKWREFLETRPDIVEEQVPTLHLLLWKAEDIQLYFNSIGFPARPPNNRVLFYRYEKEEMGSEQSWTDLSQVEKDELGQRLAELKVRYYDKLIHFVEHVLPDDYMRYEFFRNVKFAMKDYAMASRNPAIEQRMRRQHGMDYYRHKMAIQNDMKKFQQIKDKLLSTELTDEQKDLLDQINDLVTRLIR